MQLTCSKPVPDPHRGTKGTCLGPRASGGPVGPSGGAFRYWKKRNKKGRKRKIGKREEMKIRKKSERVMGERGWVRKREGAKKVGGTRLAKRGRGPAPGMCLGPCNMGIRP